MCMLLSREICFTRTVYNPFGWNFDESSMEFLIDHLSIRGIYISGTHYVLKFIRKLNESDTGLIEKNIKINYWKRFNKGKFAE